MKSEKNITGIFVLKKREVWSWKLGCDSKFLLPMVCTHLESPWILKYKFKPWKSLNFNANFIVYGQLQRKRSKHRKTFGMRLLMLWKNQKRHRLKALIYTECSPWKMGNASLKVLKFFVLKRVATLITMYVCMCVKYVVSNWPNPFLFCFNTNIH